jgi:hypothetical protein
MRPLNTISVAAAIALAGALAHLPHTRPLCAALLPPEPEDRATQSGGYARAFRGSPRK